MIALQEIQQVYLKELAHLYDKEEIQALFYRMAEHYHGYSKLQIHMGASIEDACFLRHALEDLKTGKPAQYITGIQEFMGLQLHVSPGVLIPRPETEELIHYLLSNHSAGKALKVIDLCTGSGCIALAIKKHRPNWEVHATDISETALEIARKNAEKWELNVHFHSFDLLAEWPKALNVEFDLIISNPPYVLPSEADSLHKNVLSYEPHIALFSPEEDGLGFYKRIADLSTTKLKKDGKIYLEINPLRAEETKELFKNTPVKLIQDLSGKQRFLEVG